MIKSMPWKRVLKVTHKRGSEGRKGCTDKTGQILLWLAWANLNRGPWHEFQSHIQLMMGKCSEGEEVIIIAP